MKAAKAAAAAALLTATLSACAQIGDAFLPDLPESDNVDAQPWPKLVEAPDPRRPTDPPRVETPAKGAAIEEGLSADADALRRADAEMRGRSVVDPSLDAEAEALRRRARAIAAGG